MSNHDDFIDEYIEYRMFEESMKQYCCPYSVRAVTTTVDHTHSPLVHTALLHLVQAVTNPIPAVHQTRIKVKRPRPMFSPQQRNQRTNPTHQNRAKLRMNTVPRIMSMLMISTTTITMISTIMRMRRIIITSTRIKEVTR